MNLSTPMLTLTLLQTNEKQTITFILRITYLSHLIMYAVQVVERHHKEYHPIIFILPLSQLVEPWAWNYMYMYALSVDSPTLSYMQQYSIHFVNNDLLSLPLHR